MHLNMCAGSQREMWKSVSASRSVPADRCPDPRKTRSFRRTNNFSFSPAVLTKLIWVKASPRTSGLLQTRSLTRARTPPRPYSRYRKRRTGEGSNTSRHNLRFHSIFTIPLFSTHRFAACGYTRVPIPHTPSLEFTRSPNDGSSPSGHPENNIFHKNYFVLPDLSVVRYTIIPRARHTGVRPELVPNGNACRTKHRYENSFPRPPSSISIHFVIREF